jgi:hypothetical protein
VRLPGNGKSRRRREQQTRSFGTTIGQLETLADWLEGFGVTLVGMEATGVYWKPVFWVLERRFECWLLNAQHLHNAGKTEFAHPTCAKNLRCSDVGDRLGLRRSGGVQGSRLLEVVLQLALELCASLTKVSSFDGRTRGRSQPSAYAPRASHRRFSRCLRTVCGDTNRSEAISWFVLPRATQCRISASRSVSEAPFVRVAA